MTRPRLRGRRPESVIAILERRRAGSYVAGKSDDDQRVGLVIEGGALRGVISSGAVAALHQLGFGNCFDAVYGTSSGALNAAYFVSGQITFGTTVYYENATDPHFIKLFRWPDQMDINWLIDNWIAAGKPLDLDAVMASGIDLFIPATDVETGAVRFFSNRTDLKEIIIPAIRAACSTPIFVTHAEPIEGRDYNDGMLRAGIPMQVALDDGCTHIVAALTRPFEFRKRFSPWVALLENLIRIRTYSQAYRNVYHARAAFYNDALDLIYVGDGKVSTLAVAPEPDDFNIKNTETRSEPLRQAAREALYRMADVFGVGRDKVALYGEG